MSKELYESVIDNFNHRTINEEEFPLIKELLRSISKNETKVLSSLLLFNPNKRPKCDILFQFPFFKNYTHSKRQDVEQENLRSQLRIEREEVIHESSKSKKKYAKFSPAVLEFKEQPSSVYYGNIDNTHDSSFRNMSNWWNIDPILTPKDINAKELNASRHTTLQYMKDKGTFDFRNRTLSTIPASDQQITPALSTDRDASREKIYISSDVRKIDENNKKKSLYSVIIK